MSGLDWAKSFCSVGSSTKKRCHYKGLRFVYLDVFFNDFVFHLWTRTPSQLKTHLISKNYDLLDWTVGIFQRVRAFPGRMVPCWIHIAGPLGTNLEITLDSHVSTCSPQPWNYNDVTAVKSMRIIHSKSFLELGINSIWGVKVEVA